ncbi:hypothetical protein HOA91_00705 [Candidatus Woesearchaeota archaeon]|nr:hypothetical protein [Candidatus Woesearchaeota archaeon]
MKMVEIQNYSEHFFYPNKEDRTSLEEVVLFPGGEKKKGIPNSSVWVYSNEAEYNPRIMGTDVGCGIAGFIIPEIDYKESADIVADYLKGKNILGRGNHFIDICSGINGINSELDSHMILLIHSDGKYLNNTFPKTYKEAEHKVEDAKTFRTELGNTLMKLLGVSGKCFGDWTHNSVESDKDKIIYRKGVIKVIPDEVHILPSHLGYTVLAYTFSPQHLPPKQSMPHGSGRKKPLSSFKANEEKVRELRKVVYVPEIISDASLKSEHPDCYHDPSEIFKKLGKNMVNLGDFEILSYVGKV